LMKVNIAGKWGSKLINIYNFFCIQKAY
jgi:hypothetical protein